MSYTHTLTLQDPSPLSINLKDQGLGIMISLRMSIGSTTLLSRGYSPYNLFAASEPGVWYDPSDLTTLFQDTAGTTPVTTPGQTVARINDKSGRGFHATQSTTASRPTYGIVPLGGRRNLLVRSEEFDNAVWANSSPDVPTVAANTADTVAPDGSNTSDKITAATGGVSSHLRQQVTGGFSGVHTISVFVKAGNSTQSRLRLFDNSFGTVANALINWSGGSISSLTSVTGAASFQTLENGWFRVSITTASLGFNASLFPSFYPDSSSGSGHVYLWGAQLELGSTATTYQRVGSRFDVTEAGVTSLSYLYFGGDLDPRWMVTPTITPGIDKVQVFAGVRKLSDAAGGVVAELSNSAPSNAGSFAVSFPLNATDRLGVRSSGSLFSLAGTAASSLNAPVTSVIRMIGDISGDNLLAAANGTIVAQSTADQGTGNFLAYPLYIGRRGGTSLPFNGNLYSLIVRFGANLDSNTITNTETWVNSKTGAY